MPTPVGVIFFCLGAYCFFRNEGWLLGLLVIASMFEAASAINIVGRGIQPYYLIAAFIIARAMVNVTLGSRGRKPVLEGKWLLAFGAIAIASSIALPVVYAGMPVAAPKIGIDAGVFVRPPLRLGLDNLAQAGYLACSIATAFSVPAIRFSEKRTRKGYVWAFYILAFVVFAESLCQLVGIPFPYSIILNNPGYGLWDVVSLSGGTRNPGTFSEPSLAGGLLVLYCVGFTAEYLSGKKSGARALIAFLASVAVASSGSLFVLCVVMPALLARYWPIRLPWYLNVRRAQRLGWMLLSIAPLALLLVAAPGLRETLTTLTVSKGSSGSALHRTAADYFALQLLPQTYWMGVGLGSNRASSMFATLLSNVGVAGVLTFGIFYFRLFSRLPAEYAWLRWGAYALLLNMCLGIPDITFPVFWIPIFMAIQYTGKRSPSLPPGRVQEVRLPRNPLKASSNACA